MSEDKDWGEWIRHRGDGYPPEVTGLSLQCRVEFPTGHIEVIEDIGAPPRPGSCHTWDWRYYGVRCFCADFGIIGRLVAYRIQKPKAAPMEILRELLNVPPGQGPDDAPYLPQLVPELVPEEVD